MPVALEQFVKQLADSGVIAPGKLETFIPPKAQPKDAEELARQLIRSRHLTKFQAQEIYAGRARSLLLGNYTIVDKIGVGGMGEVFKAQHRRMERVVAIKMLPSSVTKDAATAARFQREVVAAAKLSHPNIVAAYDADEANGVHFLVMEYVEGVDLSVLVKQNGPLPVAKAVDYILQAARGLEFAHAERVVHRDIKPANLLLDKKGTVKILDMGLARIDIEGDAATQSELTGTGAVMGTVDYMAPEQALSTKHADARADIYSLGCSLYYLLTGRAVYDGDTLMAKLLAHRESPIPVLGSEVPEQLQAAFNKMVAKKVGDRYQTMSEVIVALKQCRIGRQESVGAPRPLGPDFKADTLAFLRDAPAQLTLRSKPTGMWVRTKIGQSNKKLMPAIVGGAVVGIAIVAGFVLKLQTKEGTLIVNINEPDATVQVLSEEGKIEITRPGEIGSLSIAVDPGKHRLKVEKQGFQFFTKNFEIEPGGRESITAGLVPLEAKLASGGSGSAAAAAADKKPADDKTPLAFGAPRFNQWTKDVAALSAEKQVDSVIKKLRELNPGFDGKEEHKIEGEVVTEFRFLTDNVADISPVRALPGLKVLSCRGSGNGNTIGMLSDLSPLAQMKLTYLECIRNPVSDLSPLREMPLSQLICGVTQVSNLSPLKGMPLTTLNVGRTQVTDLSAVHGMSLTAVYCDHTGVASLAPLKGMSSLLLLVCDSTQVSDLSPLRGLSLALVYCIDTPISDLSPLEGMNLLEIRLTPKRITKGMDVIRRMKSLTGIGTGWDDMSKFQPAEFWKRFDAREFDK